MRVSSDNRLALTVSADHLVGRYDLASEAGAGGDADASGTVHRTSHPGNGCIAIRDDARVCAIGGWDGRFVVPPQFHIHPPHLFPIESDFTRLKT